MVLRVCWISGWASDISIWSDLICAHFPAYQHCYMDYASLMASRQHLFALPQIAQSDILVSWSLGSLILLQNFSFLNQGQTCLLYAPITHFCHPHFGWPPRVLNRMTERILSDPAGVLRAFAEKMDFYSSADMEQWVYRALRYPTDLLAEGLRYLATQTAETISLRNSAHAIHLVYGKKDQIVSPQLAQWLESELHPASAQISENGHFPFPADWSLPPI